MRVTTETPISSLLQTRERFLRSANLERDFRDPNVFSGYVLTDFTSSCLQRIAEGLKPQSGQRAWRLTGDFGSGKSSFALLLSHWFAGHDSSLPQEIRKALSTDVRHSVQRTLVPALVTCSRSSLSESMLRALAETISDLGKSAKVSKLAKEIELLRRKKGIDDDAVIDLILKTNSVIIAQSKGRGLLLVIDELGKFLEFAANNPQRQDVFLLQRLAEIACRSGNEPIFLICLLHQGFSDYADHLNQSEQREWEKVAGRFEQIIFNQPLEEIAHIVDAALNVRTDFIPLAKVKSLRQAMASAMQSGWFGPITSKALIDFAPQLYPIHPTVLPVLIRIFRRFGQNERSLFSFLLSNEPFGLQSFAHKSVETSDYYRLHDLYDYVRTTFGHKLATQSYRSHWSLIDSVIESFASDDERLIKVLKTVGILNLLNDNDLPTTERMLIAALANHDVASQKQVKQDLETLRKQRRVLYDRGRVRGFCLWPHTSVDLEQAFENARRCVDTPKNVATFLGEYLDTRPVVARRHYIKTGTLRHFAIFYCSVKRLPELFEDEFVNADGVIIVPLCETLVERAEALAFTKLPGLDNRPSWLVAVPQPLSNLGGLLQEVQRWEWVFDNVPELNADKYAREEASRQQELARSQLETAVQSRLGIRQFEIQTTLSWFHRGHQLKISDGRDLLSQLSRIFDEVYSLAPRINNELINRRNLSAAAAGARMRLIERMFTNAADPLLGMNPQKAPPEMSMYLSVLQETGLHRLKGGSWKIDEPHGSRDESQLGPVFKRIRDIVQNQPDSRISIPSLFDELRKAPFGVRDGLIPLLISAFAVAHDNEIAFYKDGTFLREMTGEAMLILTKAPERFEIQFCKITGLRTVLFHELIATLKLERTSNTKVELLDVVKPICSFVAGLPSYVLNTKLLSPTALAVRDTILAAREPGTLLFTELPNVCGCAPITPKRSAPSSITNFVKKLKSALEELRAAYPELHERMKQQLRSTFSLPGSSQQFRNALAVRAQQLLLTITEPKLRAFCLRLMDDNLAESGWLESLGSYLGLKPPAKWHDADEVLFNTQLADLAARFHHVEAISFTRPQIAQITVGVRVAVTQFNGLEHDEVVHYSAEEEPHLLKLQKQFEALLVEDKRLGLAAASRAIWKNFGEKAELRHE